MIARLTATNTVEQQRQVRPSAFVISPREVDFAVAPGGRFVERQPDVNGSTLVVIPLWNWPSEGEARKFLLDYLAKTNAYGYVLSSDVYATTFKQYLDGGTSVRDVPIDDRFNAVVVLTVNRKGEFTFDIAKVKTENKRNYIDEWRASGVKKIEESTSQLEGVFELLRW